MCVCLWVARSERSLSLHDHAEAPALPVSFISFIQKVNERAFHRLSKPSVVCYWPICQLSILNRLDDITKRKNLIYPHGSQEISTNTRRTTKTYRHLLRELSSFLLRHYFSARIKYILNDRFLSPFKRNVANWSTYDLVSNSVADNTNLAHICSPLNSLGDFRR